MTQRTPTLYDDAELYDLHHHGYGDDFAFYRQLAEDQGGPVLELGAGTGRLTAELARTGERVVAVEPNPAMRLRAERRLAEAGLGNRVELVNGDARTLRLGRTFPLVIAPFNTLMHIETLRDQDAALAAVAAHLAPGGAFACDLFVQGSVQEGVLVSVPLPAGPAGASERSTELFLWQEHDALRQLLTTHFRLDTVAADGCLRRRGALLRQRYWWRFELERALLVAGLGAVRVYGDFGRGPLTAESQVMAVVARPSAVPRLP